MLSTKKVEKPIQTDFGVVLCDARFRSCPETIYMILELDSTRAFSLDDPTSSIGSRQGCPVLKTALDNRVSAIKVRPLYLPVPNSRYRDIYLSIFWSDTKLLPPDISRGGQYSHTYSTMHHVMLLITNFKITSILTCNIKVILIVRFS